MRVAILGGGSWATAIAKRLLANVEEIGWYIRNDEKIEKFRCQFRCKPNQVFFKDKYSSKKCGYTLCCYPFAISEITTEASETAIGFQNNHIGSQRYCSRREYDTLRVFQYVLRRTDR